MKLDEENITPSTLRINNMSQKASDTIIKHIHLSIISRDFMKGMLDSKFNALILS